MDLAVLDIHVTAVLLKMYLRELPTPLFPDAATSLFDAVRGASGHTTALSGETLGLMYADFIYGPGTHTTESTTDEQRLEAVQAIVSALPASHEIVLAYVVHLLNEVRI